MNAPDALEYARLLLRGFAVYGCGYEVLRGVGSSRPRHRLVLARRVVVAPGLLGSRVRWLYGRIDEALASPDFVVHGETGVAEGRVVIEWP